MWSSIQNTSCSGTAASTVGHSPEELHGITCVRTALLLQVDLALNIMDGAPLRDDPKQVMRVQRAKFEQKGEEYVAKKKPKSKKKAAGVLTKQEKELGWGGFDDKLPANKVHATD